MNVKLVKRVAKLILGWAFILLGIVGIFLPILQGLLFLVIGLTILSSESKTAQRILNYLKARYPREYEKMHTFSNRYLHGEGFLIVLTVAGNLLLASAGLFLGLLTYSVALFALGAYFLSQIGVYLFAIKRFYAVLDPSPAFFSSGRVRGKLFWIFSGTLMLLSASITAVLYRMVHEALHPASVHLFAWNFSALGIMGGGQLLLSFIIWRERKRVLSQQSSPLSPRALRPFPLLFSSLVSLLNIGIGVLGILLVYLMDKELFDVLAALLISGVMIGNLWKLVKDYYSSFIRMGISPAIYDNLYSILSEFSQIETVYSVQILPVTFQQMLILVQLQLHPTLSAVEVTNYHQQIESAIQKKFPDCIRVLLSPPPATP